MGTQPGRGLKTELESAYIHTHIVVCDYLVIAVVSANPRCSARVSVCACVLSARLALMYLHGAHGSVCSAHLWNALVFPVERNGIETGAQVSAFKMESIRKAAQSTCQASLAFPLPRIVYFRKILYVQKRTFCCTSRPIKRNTESKCRTERKRDGRPAEVQEF